VLLSGAGSRLSMAASKDDSPPSNTPFNADYVRDRARELAANAYKEPDIALSGYFQDLNYDEYRSLRFRTERSLWRDDGLPFEVQFFHRGFIYRDRVEIYEVDHGSARLIPYSQDLFQFDRLKERPTDRDTGFAGFRVHAPLNSRDYYDEVGVFLGASYFRAIARGQVYGLSARGLSIGTGDPKGEEFPAFRTFWIERPDRTSNALVVHALIDSKSGAAALRLTIQPGSSTVFDVDLTTYPRVDIAQIGIGTLTSMFFFGANDRAGVDDYRPAVHDSDGLAIQNGHGEQIWRPLANPRDLQISLFSDQNPRGFGLFQRERDFNAYQDLESRFERRPSAWVEPLNDWGEGAIQLLEIPTKEEIHDNVVAFWRPKEPLRAKGEYKYSYRIVWGAGAGDRRLSAFTKTRVGAGPENTRRFILDVHGVSIRRASPDSIKATVTADKGEIRNLVLSPNSAAGGMRISFELVTKKEPVIELRAQLMSEDKPISEVWLYRWTP
jgi:glucans biosynthesis protein